MGYYFMKAVLVKEYNKPILTDIPVPEISDDQLLVKMAVSNICSKTDLHIIQGLYPNGDLPFVIGHEAAGTVISTGKNVKDYQVGDRVAYRGDSAALAEYSAVNLPWVMKIPDDITFEQASMMEVACCSFSLVKQCVRPGDRVLLIGQGCAGLFGTMFAKIFGAEQIIVSEPVAFKRGQALQNGADIAIDPFKEDLYARCSEITSGKGFDAILEFSGSENGLPSALDLVRVQGIIGMFGIWCKSIPFDFVKFHLKYTRITSVGYEYGYNHIPYGKMIEYAKSGEIDFAKFITHKMPLEEFDKAFKIVLDEEPTLLRAALVP